jgi:hypothetical protein
VLEAYNSGAVAAAVAEGPAAFKKWINCIGKAQKRKGKRLFMPVRVAFTVRDGAGVVCVCVGGCLCGVCCHPLAALKGCGRGESCLLAQFLQHSAMTMQCVWQLMSAIRLTT